MSNDVGFICENSYAFLSNDKVQYFIFALNWSVIYSGLHRSISTDLTCSVRCVKNVSP